MTGGIAPLRTRRFDGLLALLALGVLVVCVYYVAAYTFLAPFPGLDFDSHWQVLSIEEACDAHPVWCVINRGRLVPGDHLLTVGNVTFEQYEHQRTLTAFSGYEPGEVVPITLQRAGVVQHIDWIFIGPTLGRRLLRFTSFLLMLPFWLAGTAVLLFLRPRDQRWLLLVVFNYLTGLWIAVGNFSALRSGGALLVLQAATILMVPVYLHLHLLVPAPLITRRTRFWLIPLYLAAGALVGLNFVHALPAAVFNMAALTAVTASLALLIYRSTSHVPTSVRLATQLMLVGIGLSFGPGIILWVVPALLGSATPGVILTAIMTIALPLQPALYVYTLYKRVLGNLEFRANRVLSLYGFILLFGTGFVTAFLSTNRWIGAMPQGLAFAFFVSLAFVILALWLRAPFQRFIDRLAYGTEHNPETIIRTFANQIPRALDRTALARLLVDEVSPALLIRQSALYLIGAGETAPLYVDGTPACTQPDLPMRLQRLLSRSGSYLLPEAAATLDEDFAWVRLVVPITVGDKTLAAWLLGKRDPDDYYQQPDIELLNTLGNQIGVALETARLFEDVERRARELETAYRDLQRLDELKDEFVQNVSHELRTPLTFLRGYMDLLSEELLGPLTPTMREALETMSDRTEGLVRLVNDIISLQHAQADQAVREPVNLAALARSCIEAVEVAMRKHPEDEARYAFRLVTAENLPQISGDRRRLSQVIDNLLTNAVKFSPNGGTISIEISPCAHRFSGNGATPQPAVAVDVSDQGIGIPPAELNRIWQRFYQVDGSSTRRFGGIGLGLAIVRGIVESHGGEIWADSQEHQGTTFHIILPVAGPPAAPAAKTGLTQTLSHEDTKDH